MSNDATCSDVYNRFRRVFQFTPTATRTQIISPYINSTLDVSGIRNSFTQEDFNMRRKAEILQYNKNGTNNAKVSKREQFSRVANTTKNYRGNSNCNNTYNLQTPTYASDVPGPLKYLTLKPEVPLYMYAMNTLPTNENGTFNELFFHNDNVEFECNDSMNKTFSVVNMDPKDIFGFFNIDIPVGLFVKGSTTIGSIRESMKITGFNMEIRNNKDNSLIQYTYQDIFPNIENNGIIFDTSNNGNITVRQFVGVLELRNIAFNLEKYNIYDFYFSFTTDTSFNGTYDNLSNGVILNILGNSYNNCEKYPFVEVPIYIEFSPFFSLTKQETIVSRIKKYYRLIDASATSNTYVKIDGLDKGEYYDGPLYDIYYINGFYCFVFDGIYYFFNYV